VADEKECKLPTRYYRHPDHRGPSCLKRWISSVNTRPMSRLLRARQRRMESRDGAYPCKSHGGTDEVGVVWSNHVYDI